MEWQHTASGSFREPGAVVFQAWYFAAMRVLLTLGLLVATASGAQALEHDVDSWTVLNVWGRHDRFRWYLEAQPRVSLTQRKFDRLLLRPAVGYQVSPNVSLWVGYGWTPSFIPSYRDEQRPWQQVLVEHKFGVVSLVNRSRVEERFIANTDGASIRVRHMVRSVIRFGAESPWGVALYDEIFFTLNTVTNGPVAGFDQNRVFAGINLKVAEWQFELGYMNNFVERPAPSADRMNHNITAMIVFTVP